MSSRRNKGGGGGHGGGGEERWLLPYADMITLLLGLFIVLFAMSSIDAKQFDNVKRSLSQTFNGAVLTESGGVMPGAEGALDPSAPSAQSAPAVISMERAVQASESRFDQKKRELEKAAKEALGNDVKVTRNELGITINLAGDALFDSGSFELKPNVIDKLVSIERELAQFRHPILITGHTDSVGSLASNRLLGFNRANAVYALFLDKGFDDTRMRVETGGEAYPIDRSTADGEANGKNRRIEITVLAPGGESPVPQPVAVKRAASVSETPLPSTKATPVKTPTNPVGGAVDREVGTGIVQELAEASKAGA